MIFELNNSFRGIEVTGNGEKYLFKTKLFSHSSILLDSQNNEIASLKRSSWWRVNFDLHTSNNKYFLKQRFSETELSLSASNLSFNSYGLEFLRGSSLVTKAIKKNSTLRKIEIYEKEHWLALLVASCLECSLVAKNG